MNKEFSQDDTPESVEGTAAHWVGTEMLAGRLYSEGSSAPNGVIITGEMLDGAELIAETVARRINPITPGMLHIEEWVSIPEIHEECGGTPDVWTFDLARMHLEVFDYKYGHGFVDEYFNKQGLLYASGIIETLKPALLGDPANISVSFTVIQPRCYHRGEPVRTHNYIWGEVTARAHMIAMQAAATQAYSPKPMASTNPECCHCPGRHACEALQRAAYSDAEFATARQPHNLTPQAAGLELRMLERAYERLGARVEGLRALTLANLRAGASVPYYVAEPGKGRRQWNIPIDQLITIGQMLGKNLSKPGVVSPAQADRLGLDEAVSNNYSSIIPGAVKLVPQNNTAARRVFGKG
jgi:hypothetical protein